MDNSSDNASNDYMDVDDEKSEFDIDEFAKEFENDLDKLFVSEDEITNEKISKHALSLIFKKKTFPTEEIDRRTTLFLKEARTKEIECFDYEHTCNKKFCDPHPVTDYTWNGNLIKRKDCGFLGINPDIYYCKRGLFHECGQSCPGKNSKQYNDFACEITGIGKDSGFTSFETEKKSYWSIFTPRVLARDNSDVLHSINKKLSKERDMELNKFAIDFLKRFKKVEKIDISELKNKSSRIKNSTRQILNKCNWLGKNSDEINKLHEIYLFDIKCKKTDVYPDEKTKRRNKKTRKRTKKSEGTYLLIYEFYDFLTHSITKEQVAIQYGLISCSKIISKAYKLSSTKTLKNIKDILNLVKVTESLFLNGLLPGLARIFNQTKSFYEYHQYLLAKGAKYIDMCRRRRKLIDLNKYFFLTSFDEQKNCEKDLKCCMKKDVDFWKYDKPFSVLRTDITSFPTFNEIRRYLGYIFAIYTLVKTSGSYKVKRRTIDHSEIVVGAMYLLSKGYSLYKIENCHDCYIPKIQEIGRPGYLPFESEFSLILGIKRSISKSHKIGIQCIKDSVEYHSTTGMKPKEMRDYILNFSKII